MRHRFARAAGIILAALLFGVAVAVLKGGSTGIRDSLGNVSAPWLLLPYFAGRATRGWLKGSLLGLAACLTSLAGFYIAEAFILDLGGHPVLTNLALTLGAGRSYFIAGIVVGPLFGAIGGAAGRYRGLITATVVGLTLVGEPLAVFAWLAGQHIDAADTGFVVQYPALWIGEIVLGCVLSVAMLIWTRSRDRSDTIGGAHL
jgi:hypothetical protein